MFFIKSGYVVAFFSLFGLLFSTIVPNYYNISLQTVTTIFLTSVGGFAYAYLVSFIQDIVNHIEDQDYERYGKDEHDNVKIPRLYD